MSVNSGTQNVRYPTDFNLRALNLITSLENGVIDLMPFLVELNLFEDVYSSTISGEILLQDAMGLITNYRLNGTEFLQVELQKTSTDSVFYSRNFRVYKVGKRVIGDNNDYEVFSLNFCSEEFLLSEQYRLSKSFKGKQISDIVTTILKQYVKVGIGNKKKIYVENTKGIYDFVLPNKKLFETINWLATYAQPQSKDGSDMLFFENSTGYYFTSLQTLYSGPVYQTYKFDPKNVGNDMNQKITNVTDFEVLDFFDTLGGISNGTFGNKVIVLDILQRQKNKTAGVFNYGEYYSKNPNILNKFPVTNNYRNRLGGTLYNPEPPVPGLEMGSLRLVSGNTDQKKQPYVSQMPDGVANDIMIERYMPNRVGQMALANYTRIKVTIPGDPKLTVGRVVNFNTYEIKPSTFSETGSNSGREPDPFYSGKYLVTAVRHVVGPKGYITIVEMCKDSVSIPYAPFDKSGVILKQLVDGYQ